MKNYNENNKNITKIKIAVVYPNYGLTGGAETFVFELTERLAKKDNFEMHVFANKWNSYKSSVIFHKVPIIKFPRWIRPVSFAWFAKKAIDAGNFHIVHSHERLFKYDLLTHHGIPHITWVQEIRQKRPSLFDRAIFTIEKKGINSIEQPWILPVSNLGKEQLLQQFDILDSRIAIIHPGIDVKKFTTINHKKYRDEIRNQYKIEKNDIVILFAGMNFDVKGLDRLLKAIADFAQIDKKYKALKLLVIGKGDIKKYSKMAVDLKIRKRVIFTGIKNNMEKYYCAADIFSILSYRESFGIVVLEAMASGLPVVISETVGAKDVVKEGITGYIIQNKNFKREIINAFTELMEIKKRKEMGTQGKQIVHNYDWDVITEKVAKLYLQRLNFGSP